MSMAPEFKGPNVFVKHQKPKEIASNHAKIRHLEGLQPNLDSMKWTLADDAKFIGQTIRRGVLFIKGEIISPLRQAHLDIAAVAVDQAVELPRYDNDRSNDLG